MPPPTKPAGARAVGGDRQADRGEEHRDEECAAGQRRVVADADVRLEGEQRHEVRGPHDGAGGEAGEEQPAAAALAVHLARLGEKEERDEASRARRWRRRGARASDRGSAGFGCRRGTRAPPSIEKSENCSGSINPKAVKTGLGGRLNEALRRSSEFAGMPPIRLRRSVVRQTAARRSRRRRLVALDRRPAAVCDCCIAGVERLSKCRIKPAYRLREERGRRPGAAAPGSFLSSRGAATLDRKAQRVPLQAGA